jgi:hypothetical protein
VRVAEHEIRRVARLRGMRRHRVAIYEQASAEFIASLRDERREGRVVGLPEASDPVLGLAEGELAPVHRLAGRHHAGDGAEPGADAGARRVDPRRQRPVEHAGIEFPGLAVHVAEHAREGRREQRRAVLGRGGEELVHETVLAAAQRHRVEARRGDEGRRVGAAGMRRREDERHRLPLRTGEEIRRADIAAQGERRMRDEIRGQVHGWPAIRPQVGIGGKATALAAPVTAR